MIHYNYLIESTNKGCFDFNSKGGTYEKKMDDSVLGYLLYCRECVCR